MVGNERRPALLRRLLYLWTDVHKKSFQTNDCSEFNLLQGLPNQRFDYKMQQDGAWPRIPLSFLQLGWRSFCEGRANRVTWDQKPKVTFKKQLLTKLCEVTDFFPSVLVMFQYISVLKLAKVGFVVSRRPSLFPTQVFFSFYFVWYPEMLLFSCASTCTGFKSW